MEEPEEMWFEGFWDVLAESVPERRRIKNENVRGKEGWKKQEMYFLCDLCARVWDRKMNERAEMELIRKRRMESGLEEKGLDKSDLNVQRAINFREIWNSKWHGFYGTFEDFTLIPSMNYTNEHAPPLARPCDSLQIFSAKVMEVIGLCWPLHVFGMVAVCDIVDRNRNLVFYRTRDNYQTLNETDPYLELTGPTRTVVEAENDHVVFEICLKVKGNTDQFSGFSCIPGDSTDNVYPFRCYSKQCMLEITLGEVRSAVEATIFVRVVRGSWPDGFHGHFAAWTSSGCQNVVLFDFGADKIRVDGDGYMNFYRQVVSVELDGSLTVCFMAWRDDRSFEACRYDNEVVNEEVQLKSEKAGRSYAVLRLGSCVMKVIVAWSLVLPEPQPDVPDSFEDYPYPALPLHVK